MHYKIKSNGYSTPEDAGKFIIKSDYLIELLAFNLETNSFSFVNFINSLIKISENIDTNNILEFEYISKGVLRIDVEQKLIKSILKNFKIIFDYEKDNGIQ